MSYNPHSNHKFHPWYRRINRTIGDYLEIIATFLGIVFASLIGIGMILFGILCAIGSAALPLVVCAAIAYWIFW